MFRTTLLAATTAGMVILTASGAAFAHSGEHENGGEVSAVLAAKTSVSQAIATAEQQTGGRAMSIDVGHKKDAYVYRIKTVTKDKVAELTVDPASGKITQTEDEGLIDRVFDREDKSEFQALGASPTTLGAAVATAEKELGGKAIEARFENEDGKLRYEVEVAKDKAMHKVVVDSASGKVLKVKTAEEGEDKED